MKLKEENKLLKDKLMRAEYTLEKKREEAAELKEKNDGFMQLLELNQNILLWALFNLSEEVEDAGKKIKEAKIPMSEIYEIAKQFRTMTRKDDETQILYTRFELNE